MHDQYLKNHFQKSGLNEPDLTFNEKLRIQLTLSLIPCHWTFWLMWDVAMVVSAGSWLNGVYGS